MVEEAEVWVAGCYCFVAAAETGAGAHLVAAAAEWCWDLWAYFGLPEG